MKILNGLFKVRKDLLEKKLIDSNRDHDLIVEKLQVTRITFMITSAYAPRGI